MKTTSKSKDWNEGLANEMRNIDFAQSFILSAVKNESLSIQAVLGKVINVYGVGKFVKLAKTPKSKVLRAIDLKNNPSQETLSRLLKPFGLKVTVASVKGGKRRA